MSQNDPICICYQKKINKVAIPKKNVQDEPHCVVRGKLSVFKCKERSEDSYMIRSEDSYVVKNTW